MGARGRPGRRSTVRPRTIVRRAKLDAASDVIARAARTKQRERRPVAAGGRQRYLHLESHHRPASPDDGWSTTLYRRPRTTREVTDLTEQRSHTNDAF